MSGHAGYRGYSYPSALAHRPIYWLWARIFCPRGWHLWDETWAIDWHGMSCDACYAALQIQQEDDTC